MNPESVTKIEHLLKLRFVAGDIEKSISRRCLTVVFKSSERDGRARSRFLSAQRRKTRQHCRARRENTPAHFRFSVQDVLHRRKFRSKLEP